MRFCFEEAECWAHGRLSCEHAPGTCKLAEHARHASECPGSCTVGKSRGGQQFLSKTESLALHKRSRLDGEVRGYVLSATSYFRSREDECHVTPVSDPMAFP